MENLASCLRTCVRGNRRQPSRTLPAGRRTEHLPAAEAAAYELGRLDLADALLLLLLIAEQEPEKFERAAVRWVGRFAVETSGVRVPDLQLLLGAVAGLRDPAPRVALETIAAVAERFRLGSVAVAARRLLR